MMVVAAAPFPSFCCCPQRRPALHFSSSRITLDSRSSRTHVYRSIPQLGLGLDSSWSGLKRLGVSSSRQIHRHREKKGKCRGVVYASLFGVGAPEALVIGVVALLVFGPKGLAEVARNLGKTLRAFQPTIKELQEVSREFKSTLEREIGLDEIASSTTNSYRSTSLTNENKQAVVDPNGTPTTKPYTSEELLKVTEEQLAAAAIKPQTEASNTEERPQEASTTSDVATTKSEVTISPASTESAAHIPSSEKAEK